MSHLDEIKKAFDELEALIALRVRRENAHASAVLDLNSKIALSKERLSALISIAQRLKKP